MKKLFAPKKPKKYFSGIFPGALFASSNLRFLLFLLFVSAAARSFAQAPTLSYSSPQSYVLGAAITPFSPTSSGVAAAGYNNLPVTLGSGFNFPQGVAVDTAGNLYVADYHNNAIKKIPVGGGAQVILGSGFRNPTDVAVDAAGNVYVTDNGNNAVKEIPAGGGPIVTLARGFNDPQTIVLDAAGNIYVADWHNNAIKKIPAGGGTPVTIVSGITTPQGVEVDAAGNIYIAADGASTITEVPAGGSTRVALGSGFSSPQGVAVDDAGNIYVADYGNNAVKEIPAGGGPIVTLGAGFSGPNSVALDGAGNVYVVDEVHNAVKEIKPVGGYYINNTLPPGLSFDEHTGIISGTPTALSPATDYTITAYNSSGSASATVNIKVVSLSNNANLSDLAISSGTLTPVFAAGTTNYTASVLSAVSSTTVTPTAADPNATITVNGTPVNSGEASASIPLSIGLNTITTTVTAPDGIDKETYAITIGRGSGNAGLAGLVISTGTLAPAFETGTTGYAAAVGYATTSITITPTAGDPTEIITVNGKPAASGAASDPIDLNTGLNIIKTVVTAQDGITTQTYTITIGRGSTEDRLSSLGLRKPYTAPTAVAGPHFRDFTASVPRYVTSISVLPETADSTAAIMVNGITTLSGSLSAPVPLKTGPNVITMVVTAQNGDTKSLVVTVNRAPSANDALSSLYLVRPNAMVTTVGGPDFRDYTASVGNETGSIELMLTAADTTASIMVNNTAVASGSASLPVPLSIGANAITTVVTAEDGVSTHTYVVTVTRAAPAGSSNADEAVSVAKQMETPQIADDGILAHQGISPNGDGINDFLVIGGITNYPDNKLMIMNRNGALVYEAKGYDNSTRVFDGHSNKTGALQLPGTYFYSLDYTVKGIAKRKTGFIVLKY